MLYPAYSKAQKLHFLLSTQFSGHWLLTGEEIKIIVNLTHNRFNSLPDKKIQTQFLYVFVFSFQLNSSGHYI